MFNTLQTAIIHSNHALKIKMLSQGMWNEGRSICGLEVIPAPRKKKPMFSVNLLQNIHFRYSLLLFLQVFCTRVARVESFSSVCRQNCSAASSQSYSGMSKPILEFSSLHLCHLLSWTVILSYAMITEHVMYKNLKAQWLKFKNCLRTLHWPGFIKI